VALAHVELLHQRRRKRMRRRRSRIVALTVN
jgi:hypothetical protein